MYCPNCGSSNEENAAFCRNCGAAFPAPGVAPAAPAQPPVKKKNKALPIIIVLLVLLIAAGVAVALLFRFGILPPGAKNPDGKAGENASQNADDVTDAPESQPGLPEGTAVGYRGEALDAFFAVEYATYSGSLDAVTAEEPFGDVESVKAVSDINSPVTGTVCGITAVLNGFSEFFRFLLRVVLRIRELIDRLLVRGDAEYDLAQILVVLKRP